MRKKRKIVSFIPIIAVIVMTIELGIMYLLVNYTNLNIVNMVCILMGTNLIISAFSGMSYFLL
ncbi:hypothetical protein [Miniphocaeibacter massiliensis]|uniref:hypothetical protein n=1 Tax=Miniphocaeibacter massiliensis TaxID=2041841 RepID=UPI000C1C430B|nr:hypothetical protein [Miniphocaeibacter massiliensis]